MKEYKKIKRPKQLLSLKEKKDLQTKLHTQFIVNFKMRIANKLNIAELSPRQHKFLNQEGKRLLGKCMETFDKSLVGEISQFDVPGVSKPKSLNFYFTCHMYDAINQMSKKIKKDYLNLSLADELFEEEDPDFIEFIDEGIRRLKGKKH